MHVLTFLSCSELFLALPLSPCQKERKSATERHVVGRWVPQCQEDGSYYPVQCTTGWDCWCVDEDGREIQGTKRRGWPDCDPQGNGRNDLQFEQIRYAQYIIDETREVTYIDLLFFIVSLANSEETNRMSASL